MRNDGDDRVRITADDRERAAGVIEALGAMEDVELSIEAIATASVRDLATTAGIGPVIADRLERIVCGGED